MNNRYRRSATLRAIEKVTAVEKSRKERKNVLGRIETPKTSRQMKDLGRAFVEGEGSRLDPTRRLLFSKLGKSVDDLTVRIAQLEQ